MRLYEVTGVTPATLPDGQPIWLVDATAVEPQGCNDTLSTPVRTINGEPPAMGQIVGVPPDVHFGTVSIEHEREG